jgi:hypothetical protein
MPRWCERNQTAQLELSTAFTARAQLNLGLFSNIYGPPNATTLTTEQPNSHITLLLYHSAAATSYQKYYPSTVLVPPVLAGSTNTSTVATTYWLAGAWRYKTDTTNCTGSSTTTSTVLVLALTDTELVL